MRKLISAILITGGFLLSNLSSAASFDCTKASTPYEKAVCANSNLSSLDDQLAIAYKNARATSADPEALKKTQIDWIKSTRQCASDTSCIEKAYKDRILALSGGAQLQQPAQAVTPTPHAQPQIKKVVKLKNGNEAFFYPASIIKKGKAIEVKTGMDIEGCGKFDDLNAVVCSIIYLDSFICSESKGKRLSGSFMTGHFGGGNIIKTIHTQEEYEVIKPNTGNSLMLDAVCKG